MKTLRIVIIFLILIFFAAFLLFTLQNDPEKVLLDFIDKEQGNYIFIISSIFSLILFSTLTGLPVLYFSVVIGIIFNFPLAFLLAWLMNLIAVMATFLMVKKVYYHYFMERYGKKKIIQGIDRRIEKYGLWTIALARGIYVLPTSIINFSFPLSTISLKKYITGTMIGLLPEVFINVFAGYLLKQQLLLLSDPEQNILKIAVIAIFLLIMAGIILFIRYRRKKGEKANMNMIVPDLEND